jgi:predicted AlkP superfamily phosphohydrolase/phosphomutase
MKRFALSLAVVIVLGALVFSSGCGGGGTKPLEGAKPVVILGVDGMDPGLLQQFIRKGVMPNFENFIKEGSFSPLGTSTPPQSPVAWSSFITGMDPGGHGIFDFIHCDHENYLPKFSAALVEGAGKTVKLGNWVIPISGGHVENLRKGKAFWQYLDDADVPYLIFRIPSNFPPVESDGTNTSGMGTPDLLGSYGTFTFFTDDPAFAVMEVSGGQIIPVRIQNNKIETHFVGPVNSLKADQPDMTRPFTVAIDPENKTAKVTVGSKTVLLREGDWSEWIKVEFDVLGPLKKVSGITRLYLKSMTPYFKLYATPININPEDPALPIAQPASFSKELFEKIGYYYTQGMPEDTKALEWGVFDDADFIDQADFVFDERTRMLDAVLDDYHGGLLFFYFSTIDQTCHMLWKNMDPRHPAFNENTKQFMDAIEHYYVRMDSVLGVVRDRIPKDATLIVMSDHGFAPFYWKFNLNTWFYENGYATLRDPSEAGQHPLFGNVFWRRTRAYSLGINGAYINVRGRDAEGVVKPGEEYRQLVEEISEKLTAYRDPKTGLQVVKEVYPREDIYHGPFAEDGPDMVIGYNRGYRCSDESALGTYSKDIITPNMGKWTGDHCMATDVAPGILIANKTLRITDPTLLDFAATILELYGIEIEDKEIHSRNMFE